MRQVPCGRVACLLLATHLALVLGCPQLLDDQFDSARLSRSDAGTSCPETPCPWSRLYGTDRDASSTGSVGGSGNGGSAGSSAQGGTGGGVGGSGSSSGSGGSGGSAGTSTGGSSGSGSPPDAGDPVSPCVGCLALRVPLAQPDDEAFFKLGFGQPGLDLNDTVATLRLRASVLDDTGQLFLQSFATDADFTFGRATFASISTSTFSDTETFIDVPIDVGAISSSGFDPGHVLEIGVQILAGALFVGPVTAELLLDSITYTGSSGLPDLTFSADAQGFSVNPDVGLQTAEVIHH